MQDQPANSAAKPSDYAPRMALFFAAIFLPVGIYIPYFSVWLKELGMSAEEIALVLTIPLITRVIFTPIMATLADKVGDRRLALRLYASLYALTFALILINTSLYWIITTLILSNIFFSAIIPVSDSLAMAGTRRFGVDYGRMRLWGSALFILGNILGGQMLQMIGASHLIWLIVAANCVQILLALALPSDPRLADGKKYSSSSRISWAQLRQFGQLGFWIIICAAALIQSTHSLLYGFASIFWRELDFSASVIGLFWAVSVVAEIVLFTFSRRISAHLSWKKLLALSATGAMLRWILFPLEFPEWGYLVLQILHALSFGASHLGMVFFIAEVVDDELSGTAQGLYTMLSGLMMALATYASGLLYAQLGGGAFYSMAAIALLSAILLLSARLFPFGRISAEPEEAGGQEPKPF